MFSKDLKQLKNKQTEINNTITEMKNILEEISDRIMKQKNGKVTWKIK